MISIENYLYDGAGWQARMVMCYLQSRYETILDKTYTKNAWSPYEGQIFINQYQYGREKGYVFSLRYKNEKQVNYAVYQHCISDCICVVKSNALTDHSDGWDGKEWSKYEHDVEFSWNDVMKCGEWIENDMCVNLNEWIYEGKKKKHNEEKEHLVGLLRNSIREHGTYSFREGEKVFFPTYFGEIREESICEVYLDDDDIPIIRTHPNYGERDDVYDYSKVAEFSNEEISEILDLLGIK